jgi:hypothetical protein
VTEVLTALHKIYGTCTRHLLPLSCFYEFSFAGNWDSGILEPSLGVQDSDTALITRPTFWPPRYVRNLHGLFCTDTITLYSTWYRESLGMSTLQSTPTEGVENLVVFQRCAYKLNWKCSFSSTRVSYASSRYVRYCLWQ